MMPAAIRIALAALLGAGTSLAAQEAWQADAFGLYRAGSDDGRDRWAGLRTGEAGTLREPGPVARLHFVVGPKSVPAGKEPVHLVALGFDADGNLVADGTEIRIAPGTGGRVTLASAGGIAGLLHEPGVVARGFVAGAETDAVQSLRASYRVTADLGSVVPRIAPLPPILDETLAEIRLPALKDRFGNPAEDGTGLGVWLTDRAGRGARIDAETTSGAGAARFLVREMTGALEARAILGARTSPVQGIDSLPLRPEGDPAVRIVAVDDIGAQRISVGPFRTAEGHLLSDGVALRITASAPGHAPRVEETWVRDGMAAMLLPWRAGQPVTVSVDGPLGRSERTVVAGSEARP